MDHEEQANLREMVNELCDLDEGLAPLEVTFVDDVSRWEWPFTDKQAETIRRIHGARVK